MFGLTARRCELFGKKLSSTCLPCGVNCQMSSYSFKHVGFREAFTHVIRFAEGSTVTIERQGETRGSRQRTIQWTATERDDGLPERVPTVTGPITVLTQKTKLTLSTQAL